MKLLLLLSQLKKTGLFTRFLKDRSAVAMTEFAMMLPLIMLMTLGSFEVGRYALLTQKLDRITATMADLVARAEALSATEMDNLFNSTDHLASPFDFTGSGMVVVTSVLGREDEEPLIIGQRSKGTITGVSSKIGMNGGDATLPAVFTDGNGQTLADGEGVIIAEVFYNYAPYFTGGGAQFFDSDFFGDLVVYRQAFFRPRLSEQTTFN